MKYLEEKFVGKTSKILTLNTLSGKLLIKECGKIVAEKPESEMNVVSSMIPKVFGQVNKCYSAWNSAIWKAGICCFCPSGAGGLVAHGRGLTLRGVVQRGARVSLAVFAGAG